MMNRKQFLRSLAGVGVGVFGVSALAGCGNDIGAGVDAGDQGFDEDGPADNPNDGPDDAPHETLACTPGTSISNNHGHAVVVPAADVIAGVQKQYSIQGTSAHRHFITVTAAMFAQLKLGTTVTVVSGGVSHTHVVTISCVLAEPCKPTTTISANHGHALVVPEADVVAGAQKQYSIQGTSAHRHFVTITAAMFGALRAGTPIEVLSGGVSHRHTVTVSCTPAMPACTPSSVIGSNHGHTLLISADDVTAGVEKLYDVTGTSSHPHEVLVTAAMFAQLKNKETVMASATGGNHTHDVMISCA
jgi:hypothetical protein